MCISISHAASPAKGLFSVPIALAAYLPRPNLVPRSTPRTTIIEERVLSIRVLTFAGRRMVTHTAKDFHGSKK